jgi:ATP-dependent helicase/nuclease subunit B
LPFQARQRWLALLDQVSLLDFTGERMTWSACIDVLVRATRQTLFTAETRGAPVQILGAAEAAGLSFDALWFMHVQEDTWPASGRLHPLLIPTLQQQAGMPHARHDLDQQLAQAQMLRIAASTNAEHPGAEAICSFSEQVDGTEARPSQLLELFSAADAEALPAALEGSAIPIRQCAVVAGREPARAAAWPMARPAGGSELLKRQAACGFQSFAVKRLKAEAIEQEAWGLDDRDRATLLHAALQHLWKPASANPGGTTMEPRVLLHTQDNLLLARNNGTLPALVDEAIERAVRLRAAEAAGDPWLQAYLQSERTRLRTRMLAWLEVESDRADFAVEAVEQDLRNVQVGPLILNLRVDRIDVVEAETEENSGLLLIDYKTASTLSTSAWDGERPDEPQLPIYALYGISVTATDTFEAARPVVGIAFAQVHPGKDKLMGRARNPHMQLNPRMKEKEASLATLDDAMLAEWDTAITALATDFAEGVALVDPKKGATTCRLCGLQGVCRVSALNLVPDDEDEAEDNADKEAGPLPGRGALAG